MPILRNERATVFFAHIPKTGGSSVEEYMQAQFGPLELYDPDWLSRKRLDLPRQFASSDQHLVWDDARKAVHPAPDLVFGLVRDPLKRAISEYHFQARSFPWMQRLIGRGFSAWLAVMEAAYRRDPYVMDNHLRPQSDFLPEGARVFRLEEGLEPVQDWLHSELGGERGEIPHAQKSPDAARHVVEVTRADRLRIMRLYREDYARFGYPRPVSKGLALDFLRPDSLAKTLYAKLKGRKVARGYSFRYM